MKIRKKHPIIDRLKVIVILLILLWILGCLVAYIEEKNGTYKKAKLETLLKVALQPVGNTMYIWGGGWNEADDAAGATATQIGVHPNWELFAKEQTASYDYKAHYYKRAYGLDCSGYIGWVIYNTFETKNGKNGYVTSSTEMAQTFAERGFGMFIQNPKEFLPGDIVSMDGHVWLSLGTCTDGSVLLVHSSPPGVSVCGTESADGGGSIAIDLATAYMQENHPTWQQRYSNRAVSTDYLKDVSVLRWNVKTMSDARSMQKKSAEEIIRLLSQIQTE